MAAWRCRKLSGVEEHIVAVFDLSDELIDRGQDFRCACYIASDCISPCTTQRIELSNDPRVAAFHSRDQDLPEIVPKMQREIRNVGLGVRLIA